MNNQINDMAPSAKANNVSLDIEKSQATQDKITIEKKSNDVKQISCNKLDAWGGDVETLNNE